MRYLDVQNTEDYLRALAAELTGSPQLGWLPMAAPQGNHPASETGREPRDLPRQPNIGPITTSTGLDDQRDVFISHASEDKDVIARPIAEELLRRGRSVWFDEFELTLGDSLRRSIDRGLAESRFGLVILSPSFFAKQWPQRELDGLTTREIAGSTKVILPVWHEVDHAYGPRREFDLASANDFLRREIGWIQKHIVLDRILSPSIYQQAFGAPGQSGDPNKIEGMARRLLSVYESWLDWAAGLRNTSVPPAYEEVLETTACLIDGPVLSVREFIDHVAHETARLPELAADGTDEHPITLTFELKLDIEDEVVDRNDFRALMENEAPGHLGSLNFDLRGTRADEATAGAIQNYMVRTRGGWESHFLCVPNFTVSSVSPGLQAADVIAYLGAHLAPGQDRPELQPYVDRMRGLTYQFTRPGRSARHIRTARRVG